jgi:hypothetical protein
MTRGAVSGGSSFGTSGFSGGGTLDRVFCLQMRFSCQTTASSLAPS